MNDVRSIRLKDLTTCSSCSHVGSCTRCPGLAYMEGNMRGPSSQDCEKSFARTGIPSANMLAKKRVSANLVQIRALPTSCRCSRDRLQLPDVDSFRDPRLSNMAGA